MAKNNKNSNLVLNDIFKLFISTSVFKDKNLSLKLLLIAFFVFQSLLGIVSILKNLIPNYSFYSNSYKFFSVFFGWSVIYLVLYGLFYIFLCSFEEKRKPFFESFLVSMLILLPFVFIGSLFDYIGLLTLNILVLNIARSFFIVLVIYFLVMFLLNFKNYFKTSIFKIITSFSLMFISILVFVLLYLTSALYMSVNF